MSGRLLGELYRRPIIVAAMTVVIALVASSILVPLISDLDASAPRLSKRLEAPSWAGGDGGLLGTDSLGRDLLLRIMLGMRTSFAVGAFAALMGAVVGTLVGLISGYFGGVVDAVLMRLTDIELAFPGILLVMVLVRALDRGVIALVIVLGSISWMLYARVVRSAVLTLRTTELVTATTGLGATTPRILFVHVLPNVAAAAVSLMAVTFAAMMLAEASLSFIGFGVQPPDISLGSILSSGRDYLSTSWWISTFSGLFLLLGVLSTNLIGSWLQRVTDPLSIHTGS
ncbi:MAG: ABC transporter permease [Actinomycetota bacterium]|nr:ABC transporter permease [Actinomycetota bacterium]